MLPADITAETLDAIDICLRSSAEIVKDTRTGRSWEIWVEGRPISVSAHAQRQINFAAGCNSRVDHILLQKISSDLAAQLGGKSSEPIK
jgi:hypothetical protein